jgi:hypothetical protein
MKCWKCGDVAAANCIFCGRCVCENCAATYRYVSGIAADKYSGWGADLRKYDVVVVDDAIWCGVCQLKTIKL